MSERPTPEQIANSLVRVLQGLPESRDGIDAGRFRWLQSQLRSGAVIVHPDDIPEDGPLEPYAPNDHERRQDAARWYRLGREHLYTEVFGGGS